MGDAEGNIPMQAHTLSSQLLLTVHIAASVGVLGADLVLLVLGISGLSGGDAQALYPAAHLKGCVADLAACPAGARHWPAADAGHAWGAAAILVGGDQACDHRRSDRCGPVRTRAAARRGCRACNRAAADPLSVAERLPLAIAPATASALLLLALALAVFKPPWRLRSRDEPAVTGEAG
jgi:hypothetical protein